MSGVGDAASELLRCVDIVPGIAEEYARHAPTFEIVALLRPSALSCKRSGEGKGFYTRAGIRAAKSCAIAVA